MLKAVSAARQGDRALAQEFCLTIPGKIGARYPRRSIESPDAVRILLKAAQVFVADLVGQLAAQDPELKSERPLAQHTDEDMLGT
jgi:hypothetical protein